MGKSKSFVSRIAEAFSGARADIDQIRREIEEVASEIAAIDGAPLPIEEAMQRFEDEMERRHQEAEQAVSPYHFTERNFPGWEFSLAPERVLDGVLWAIGAETIRANVLARLTEFYAANRVTPMADAQRTAALSNLQARKRDLERREEAMVCDAQGAIPRREGVKPEIFLEAEG